MLTTNPNFIAFLSNTRLVDEFILLILRSHNEKETDNVLMEKKRKQSLVRRVFLKQYRQHTLKFW
jgi:hypothetical protein